MSIGAVVVGLIVAAFAFGLSYQFTGKGSDDKFKSYFTCLCVTYALSVFFAEISGASIQAGEQVYEWSGQVATRDIPEWSWQKKVDFSRFIFWASIIPAMLGVYCARRSPASED